MIPWAELSVPSGRETSGSPGEFACSAKLRVCPDMELLFSEGNADGDGAMLSEHVTPSGPSSLPGSPDTVGAP